MPPIPLPVLLPKARQALQPLRSAFPRAAQTPQPLPNLKLTDHPVARRKLRETFEAYDRYNRRRTREAFDAIPRPDPKPLPDAPPVPARKPLGDPRSAQNLPEFAEPPARLNLRLNLPRPPVRQAPRPRTPLRQALETSRRINDKLTQVNRGLNDLVFPGLNQTNDFLVDQTIKGIKSLVKLAKQQRLQQTQQVPQIQQPLQPPREPHFTASVPTANFPQLPAQTYPPGLPPDPNLPLTQITIKYGYNRKQVSVTYNPFEGIRSDESVWVYRTIDNPIIWTFYTYGIPKLSVQSVAYDWQPVWGIGSYNMVASSVRNSIVFEGWQQNNSGIPVYVRYTTGITVFDSVSIAPNGNPYAYAGSASGTSLIVYSVEIFSPQPLPTTEPDYPQLILVREPGRKKRLDEYPKKEKKKKKMTCDLSPIVVALRQVLASNNSLNAQVTQANLQINANINELKPPVATINATTQTTATTVNSVSNVVQSTATKVDDLATGLSNVTGTVNTTATRVQNVASKLDDVGSVVNNVRTKLDDVGDLVGRTFNRIGEVFDQITKRLDKWAKWFRLPMLLDALSFILLLHNAAMLSSNVVQTIGEILNTGLQIIGLQDPDGGGFDPFDVVGKEVDQFMSSVLGSENWTKTKVTWKKLNNIYQAAANVISSMQSIIDSTRSIMELGAEMTGKVGNALKKAGVVFENAFNWFPEQINTATARQTKLNGMIQGIQSIDDTASSLSSAVSEVKSIQDTIIEIKEQRQKFNSAVQELVTGKTETETETKVKSQSTTINPSDLKP